MWADPNFDDSNWPVVSLSQSLGEQGFESYSGYAWYRLKLQPQQVAQFNNVAAGQPLSLLIAGDSVGQLAAYLNGIEAGRTRGMAESPSEYQSPPIMVRLGGNGQGPVVVAIRTWAGPTVTINRGLLTKVEIGAENDLSDRLALAVGRQWNESVIAALVVTFLFLCVAVLGGFLYLAQRHHPEYLWMTLMCLAVAAGGAADSAFGLGQISLSVYRIFTLFTGRIFMAITLEFVLHFTANRSRRLVRGVQIAALALPFLYFIPPRQMYDVLSIAIEILFCGVVTVLLFQAWREGRKEAGVMLLPFFLAATADSADTVLTYAAYKHWLPGSFMSPRFHLGPVAFGTGTVAYTVFLGSLIAVILYRFVRISQEEQRSAAEISAARSVQSLLIPTQLPSTRNFMLESAYLPVNGVGRRFLPGPAAEG